jgi:hypothetical protein
LKAGLPRRSCDAAVSLAGVDTDEDPRRISEEI